MSTFDGGEPGDHLPAADRSSDGDRVEELPGGEAPGLEIPTDTGGVPGWGCVLSVILLTLVLLVGGGACSGVFDPGDDAPSATTATPRG